MIEITYKTNLFHPFLVILVSLRFFFFFFPSTTTCIWCDYLLLNSERTSKKSIQILFPLTMNLVDLNSLTYFLCCNTGNDTCISQKIHIIFIIMTCHLTVQYIAQAFLFYLHSWHVCFDWLMLFMLADSLRYTSALAVALAFIFLVITAGITIIKWLNGNIAIPSLLPNITNIASVWNLFTAVPVLVTAFICHFNGTLLDHSINGICDVHICMHTEWRHHFCRSAICFVFGFHFVKTGKERMQLGM